MPRSLWLKPVLMPCAAAVACTVAAAEPSTFANLVRSNYVHCAFYKAYDTDPVSGDPIMVEGKADVLMYIQGIDLKRGKARVIYTRMSGVRDVTVIQTAKALHFIDNVAGMYVMTTVYACIDFDEKRGMCVTYGAVNSRVFDSSVMSEPDKVYENIKKNADPGFCDHSFIGIKDAAQPLR
jgi:hypothetical protein